MTDDPPIINPWDTALDKALAASPKINNKTALEQIADRLVVRALAGEQWCILEIAHRGKNG